LKAKSVSGLAESFAGIVGMDHISVKEELLEEIP